MGPYIAHDLILLRSWLAFCCEGILAGDMETVAEARGAMADGNRPDGINGEAGIVAIGSYRCSLTMFVFSLEQSHAVFESLLQQYTVESPFVSQRVIFISSLCRAARVSPKQKFGHSKLFQVESVHDPRSGWPPGRMQTLLLEQIDVGGQQKDSEAILSHGLSINERVPAGE